VIEKERNVNKKIENGEKSERECERMIGSEEDEERGGKKRKIEKTH
jgi:hypothetical protein